MQTRLQKLELLRRALFIATKQLFPELDEYNIYIDLRIHRSSNALLYEGKLDGFREWRQSDTFWLENETYHGNLCIFK